MEFEICNLEFFFVLLSNKHIKWRILKYIFFYILTKHFKKKTYI